jgi:Chlorophyll A-B binding protein
MQTKTNQSADKNVVINSEEARSGLIPTYNGVDRNAWLFGWNPQQELWNGRLAMIGFVAYLLWDVAGYSVLRDALHLMR